MPLVKVGPRSRLEPGSVMEVCVGEEIYAVCNVDGALYAVAGACPHNGGPLGHGAMNGYNVVCPWHLWEFDCRTGAYDRDPGLLLRTFPVRVEGDDILLELP